MNELLGNPQIQTILTLFLIGGVHALCISDIIDAYEEGQWGKIFKQLLIEGCLIFLTWQGFLQPVLSRKQPALQPLSFQGRSATADESEIAGRAARKTNSPGR